MSSSDTPSLPPSLTASLASSGPGSAGPSTPTPQQEQPQRQHQQQQSQQPQHQTQQQYQQEKQTTAIRSRAGIEHFGVTATTSEDIGRQEMHEVQQDLAGTPFQVKKKLGSGNFGVTMLLQHTDTQELVAGKFIPRGNMVNLSVEREILNHRMLVHPHIIRFRQVFVTPRLLCIVMDYATGGELFGYLRKSVRLQEDHARYFFQQLVSGISFCHDMGVSHRDLKLENTLIFMSPEREPWLKICDFGFSKHSVHDSQPKSAKGTVEYLAPEVVLCSYKKHYDAHQSDVWSCGVILYLMLCGSYPFEDPSGDSTRAVHRTVKGNYSIPSTVVLSEACKDLIRRIFVVNPHDRITLAAIQLHPWFMQNLPLRLQSKNNLNDQIMHIQTEDDVRQIIHEARVVIS